MAKQEKKEPAKVKVKVIRAFYYGGERRGIGDVIEMSEVDYLQWRAGQKVQLVLPAPAEQEQKKAPEESAFQQGGGFSEPKRKKEGK